MFAPVLALFPQPCLEIEYAPTRVYIPTHDRPDKRVRPHMYGHVLTEQVKSERKLLSTRDFSRLPLVSV